MKGRDHDRAAGHCELGTMTEGRTRPDDEPAAREAGEARVERDASERDYYLHARQRVPFRIEVDAAGEHLLGRGLVVWRRASDG